MGWGLPIPTRIRLGVTISDDLKQMRQQILKTNQMPTK